MEKISDTFWKVAEHSASDLDLLNCSQLLEPKVENFDGGYFLGVLRNDFAWLLQYQIVIIAKLFFTKPHLQRHIHGLGCSKIVRCHLFRWMFEWKNFLIYPFKWSMYWNVDVIRCTLYIHVTKTEAQFVIAFNNLSRKSVVPFVFRNSAPYLHVIDTYNIRCRRIEQIVSHIAYITFLNLFSFIFVF